MNDLVDFFKRKSRQQRKGPYKTICATRGPAVTHCTYFIKRVIPMVIITGSHYNTQGPAVDKIADGANNNQLP